LGKQQNWGSSLQKSIAKLEIFQAREQLQYSSKILFCNNHFRHIFQQDKSACEQKSIVQHHQKLYNRYFMLYGFLLREQVK